MEIEIFALCDAANISQEEKLNLLGVFEVWNPSDATNIVLRGALAIRVRFDLSEVEQHNVYFRLVDMDGQDVLAPNPPIIIPARRGVNRAYTFNHFSTLTIRLKTTGEYCFELFVDNKSVATCPLYVSQGE